MNRLERKYKRLTRKMNKAKEKSEILNVKRQMVKNMIDIENVCLRMKGKK